jgi:putative aldouronate transport system substrate-binding protein
VTLPAYVPLTNLPRPDLPGTPDGLVAPGYTHYPADLQPSMRQPPGRGSQVNVMTFSLNPPPSPLEQNQAWQEVNRKLGVRLNIPTIPGGDYATRLATTVTDPDLPDILTLSFSAATLGNLPAFLERACEDLTPYLSGDAIKTYPNLANLPTYTWRACIFNNRIFTVPLATEGRRATAPVLIAHTTDLDSLSVTEISSVDELTRIGKQLNNPGTRWAFGGVGILTWLVQVFGGPCVWRESGGSFTRDIETEEYREAVAYHRSLWDAGLFHPNSGAMAGFAAGTQFHAGRYAFGAYLNWSTFQFAWDLATSSDRNNTLRPIVPFNHDGNGRAPQFLPAAATAIAALKKSNPDRIREVLGVLNYLAAPFGTTERLLLQCGLEGVDFIRDAMGNPVQTQQGTQEMSVPWANVVGPPEYLYDSASPDFVARAHQFELEHFALTLANPALGLFSAIDASKGIGLRQTFTEGVNEIVFGKRPVSDLDELVKNWRANGGDTIRTEYQAAVQNSA